MNVMREIERMNARELELGIAESASWHADYSHSAYVFIGGLDYELTEGDIICLASQYGEVVDCNLVRDKTTGRSRGFCFLAYEDQRSAVLLIDNMNGFRLLGRSLRVDHADRYRRPKTEAAAAAGSADSEFLMFEGEQEDGYDQRRLRIWDYSLHPPLPAPAAAAGGGGAAGSRARGDGGGGERAAGAGSAPTSYTVDLARVGVQEMGEDSSAGRILRLWEEKKRKRQEREAEDRRREREEKDRREGRAASFGDQLLDAPRPQLVIPKRPQEPERREKRSAETEAGRDSSRAGDRRDRRPEKHHDDKDHRHRRRRHRSRSRSGSRSPEHSRRDSRRR